MPTSSSAEEKKEKEKGRTAAPLTIQLHSSPHSHSPSPSSFHSPEPSASSALGPTSRVRSVSGTGTTGSPTASPSPHLLAPTASRQSPHPPALRVRKVYAPKCIALLSLHPFLSQSREFLSELYRISLVPSALPLEHLIANAVNEIPLPPLGEVRVQFAVSNKLIVFFRPPPNNPLLCTHYPLRLLFECLDTDNALRVIEAVLLEQRILLLSSKLSALAVVAETLLHLIFPLRWPHVYIPLLPRSLIDFLFAPMPFIIGMHHSYVKNQLTGELMSDIIVVDLDHNKVSHHIGGGDGAKLRQLPSRERKKVRKGLSLLNLYKPREKRSEYEKRMMESMDDAFPYAPSPDEIEEIMAVLEHQDDDLRRFMELEDSPAKQAKGAGKGTAHLPGAHPSPVNHELFISSVFFRAFTSLLKDYHPYLIRPTEANPRPDPCFNRRGFLRHHEQASHGFLSDLIATQAFTTFCEERIFAAEAAASDDVRFFDESVTAKKNRSRLTRRVETPFLSNDRFMIKETYVVPAADVTGTKGPYHYDVWPQLDFKLFPVSRRIPAFHTRRQASVSALAGESGSPSGDPVRFSLMAAASLEQVLYTVWFILASSVASDYRIHHVLNTAFKVLYDARLCGVTLEEDAFVRLMKACGACSIPDKAVEVLSIMQESGHLVDGVVGGQLLQLFSMKGGEGLEALKRLGHATRREGIHYSPAASPHASITREESDGNDLDEDDDSDAELSASSSTRSSANSMQSPTSLDNQVARRLLSPSNDELKRERTDDATGAAANALEPINEQRLNGGAVSPTGVLSPHEEEDEEEDDSEAVADTSNAIERPSPDDLTRFHRNFMAAYPRLCIDTTDRCPDCQRELSDREIRMGWTDRPTDYTTQCPKCGERFAAHFVISVNPKPVAPAAAPSPTDGGTSTEEEQYAYQRRLQSAQYAVLNQASYSPSERFPLTVPYLPPRVLRKELARVIEDPERSIQYIMNPSFRLHSAPLYWNLAWHLVCLCLPVQLLLWDMSDPQAVAGEKNEMVHVLRSMSAEEREVRDKRRADSAAAQHSDRARGKTQHRGKRRVTRRPRPAEISQSSRSNRGDALSPASPSPSSASIAHPPLLLSSTTGDARLATVEERSSL